MDEWINKISLFTFLSSHDGSKDHHVPAIFTANFPEDMPSLGLTGETNMDDSNMDDSNMDDMLQVDDQIMPRKRFCGERIVWTPEEDEHLRAAVQKYGDKTEKWAVIAACVPGRTNKNCRKRWFHSLDPSLKKGSWTEEEDHLLRTGVQSFKGQWSKIAERIKGRTDDQCAKRWRESLDPHIDRAAWTPEDDVVLLQKFEEYGSQWQKIALSFPGRPGLHCRNRWRKIQRSLNHMHRASKRRRNQLQKHKDTTTLAVEAQVDEDIAAGVSAQVQGHSPHEDEFGGLDDSGDSANTDQDKDDGKVESNPDEEKPYGCAVPMCTFESSSPSLLFYHFKASHHGSTIQKPFRCTMPACVDRKRYKNINGLQYHITHAKNTPGHGGSSHLENGQAPAATSVPATNTHPTPASLSQQSSSATSTLHTQTVTAAISSTSPVPLTQPTTVALDPTVASRAFTGVFTDISEAGPSLALAPTPAEIQLQIQPQRPHQPSVSHQAFNIPHTPEPMDGLSSPMSMDITMGQPQVALFQCPELGCGQTFHVIAGLNAHMANNHGHRSMTMKSGNNHLAFGSGSISIPENDYDDMEMDLAYLASESSSPMDMEGHILLDDAELQAQLESMAQEHGALSMDPNTAGNAQAMSILSMNELLFANHISNTLGSNRIHFGSHINVSADEPNSTLPSTPAPSTNVSPRMTTLKISSPTTPIPGAPAPIGPVAALGSAKTPVVKKFPCTAVGCPKSYANNSTLRAHMRNDHPDLYAKLFKPNHSAAATTPIPSSPSVTLPTNVELMISQSLNDGSLATEMARSDSSTGLLPNSPMDISYHMNQALTTSGFTPSGPSGIAGPGAGSVPKSKAPRQSKKAAAAATAAAAESTLMATGALTPSFGANRSAAEASVSDEAMPYKCLVPGCGKGYTNISGLKNHLLGAHGSTPRKA
ncbi:hypothetical protein EMPS_00398 [Entomortierella parvispora]|uniref:Uncharacterized protein n=1 Tax=Entomortierella parvispora TaxID=205924 RepID=A0A9P3H121_9FUNG|nr:hypothetical protein EMPS_00398 [Entomortierella parvispora]